ncbi:uncharacterized protein PpBr36_06107 [Pyricularia pennisetigena]|uniref:uncharacterized protein n=1 Tax=Pyricularia pennisetigena TaxID=1578925 RepID=UPI001153C353|nr:uncharacterized protein PpBr36_06107 [Pyricularia pennisetigena]TLS22979.1 hypothetical protein PpBr36_06107 [Pyricularia pennisetigena]
MSPQDSSRQAGRHREAGSRKHHKRKSSSHPHRQSRTDESGSSSGRPLSIDALARLNEVNAARSPRHQSRDRDRDRERDVARERERQRQREEEREYERVRVRDSERNRDQRRERDARTRRPERTEYKEVDRLEDAHRSKKDRKRKKRVVSGAALEEGRGKDLRGLRGGGHSSIDSLEKEPLQPKKQPRWKNKKFLCLVGLGIGIVLLILIISVAVVVSRQNDNASSSDPKSNLKDIDRNSIPPGAPSYLNPFEWQDTKDFNLTYTDQTVGDLPVMGLFSSWDDSKRANDNVPPLNKPWGSYASRPARGVNLGGWLSIEPFITADLYDWDARTGIIDEWTLCSRLGSACPAFLEKHYSSFVNEQTFKDIQAAGLDHIRIPFSYWAVQTYDGDPYVFRTSWRYLLRAIEWARKYGLRVNLDLHGLPGSQNGWNHSGRQGEIGWLNGTDGALNAQRSLDIHDRLSKFFAQDRYRNIITHYGLANEPKMTALRAQDVVDWTSKAYDLVRKNGVKDAIVVFGDGFMGLYKWQGQLTGYGNGLALDVHQYVIFNSEQIAFNHTRKIEYACDGWTKQTQESMNTATGFGPTLIAEWSQADTDCAKHLTNVGWGNRWTGTYRSGDPSSEALSPRCPTKDSRCECGTANADASRYSDTYKTFLRTFAEAQMHSFEKGWGWFYWTWEASHAQWSYKKGLAAGILPAKAWERSFNCDLGNIPSFAGLPETF